MESSGYHFQLPKVLFVDSGVVRVKGVVALGLGSSDTYKRLDTSQLVTHHLNGNLLKQSTSVQNVKKNFQLTFLVVVMSENARPLPSTKAFVSLWIAP